VLGWHIRNTPYWPVTTPGARTLNESVDFHNVHHYGHGPRRSSMLGRICRFSLAAVRSLSLLQAVWFSS